MRAAALRLVLFVAVAFTEAAADYKKCNPKSFPGLGNPGWGTVCVCDASYCDEFPPLGTLRKGQVAVYTSSSSGKRFERTDLTFAAAGSSSRMAVTLNPKKTFQTIFGFGGAFTESAGTNLNRLSQGAKGALMNAYFGSEGIGYTTGRVPIASCDMGTRVYSYCDTDGDFQLKTFNLSTEDFTLKIPYIKWARNLTKELRLFASPWSAPGWMKESGKMVGGGVLKGDFDGEYYKAWANYFIRFFEEYAKTDIRFWGVTVENEPSAGADAQYAWQALYFSPAMQRDFVKFRLGPALRGNVLTRELKLIINDDQRFLLPDTADEILADPLAAQYVDGIGVHWYEDFLFPASILTKTHNNHPTKFILGTEACNGWLPFDHGVSFGDWSRGESYGQDIIADLQNWVVGWTDWNLCLDETGGPTWVKNFLDAPIIVNNTADEFYKQPMYYVLGHFSKLIRPDSVRVELDIQGYSANLYLEGVAFRTPDSQFVVVLQNRHDTNSYQLEVNNPRNAAQSIAVDIEKNSIITLVFNNY